MIKIIIIIAILLLWYFMIIRDEGLNSTLRASIHALMDGFGGMAGIIAIILIYGVPILLLIWLLV